MVAKRRNVEGSVMVTGRLSFPALAEPDAYEGGKPRYAVNLLIPKDSEEYKLIHTVTDELLRSRLSKSVKPAQMDAVIRNIRGDSKACAIGDGDVRTYDGYANHWVISAYNNLPSPRPTCLNKFREKVEDKNEIAQMFYSGCYVHCILNFWVQDNKHGKALRCSCGGVMFAKDGDRFSGASVASTDDFSEIEPASDEDLF